jgi:hypothetical protein
VPAVASLVTGDLIESARDEHSSFDSRRHPNAILIRALSRYQRRLVPRIIRLNRSVLTTTLEQALPLANFDAGIALLDYKYPAAVEVETIPEQSGLANRKFPVDLVSWQARTRYHLGAYIRNNVLYLTGSAPDWLGFTKVRFFYMPEVEKLTTAASVLVVPNAAEPCLVAFLASVMAQRGTTDEALEKPDAGWFRSAWREAEEEFLDEMGMHTQAQVSVVKEVF